MVIFSSIASYHNKNRDATGQETRSKPDYSVYAGEQLVGRVYQTHLTGSAKRRRGRRTSYGR